MKKSNKKEPQYLLIVHSDTSNSFGERFGHLSVCVRINSQKSFIRGEEICTVEWQCDPNNVGWYAGKAKVEGIRNNLDVLHEACKFLSKFKFGDGNPLDWINTVLASGIAARAVYDNRVDGGEFIPVSDVKPNDYHRVLAVIPGSDERPMATLCRKGWETESLAKAFGQYVAQGVSASYTERFGQWVVGGKMWEPAYRGGEVPEIAPLDALCKPLKESADKKNERKI